MRRVPAYCFSLGLTLLSSFSFAQANKIDSLFTLIKEGRQDTQRVNQLNALAKELITAGDYQKAVDYSHESLELSEALNFKSGTARAYNNLGVIYWNQGNNPKALEVFLIALKLDEEQGNKMGIAKCTNNIGLLYDEQEKYAESLSYYLRALKMHGELGNKKGMANTLSNIGSSWYAQSDFQKALNYYQQALSLTKETGDLVLKSNLLLNIGQVYFYTGETEKALDYYFDALELEKKLGYKKGETTALCCIGEAYLKQKQYKEAEKYLLTALAKSDSLQYLMGLRDNNFILSELYEQTGKPGKALEHYKQYTLAKDSLFNEERNDDMTRQVLNYEFEKKEAAAKAAHEKETVLAAAESRRQQVLFWLITAVAIGMGTIAFIIFRSLRITRNQKIIIEEKNKIVEEKNKNISDSINYARRIQEAIFPAKEIKYRLFPDAFVMFQPKDVVSGDFYWFTEKNGRRLIAAVDCTGHGVPGAFMSLIGNTFLHEIVNEEGTTQPDLILGKLRQRVTTALKQTGAEGETHDGMDIALLSFDDNNSTVEYAGVNNPLWLCRNGMLKEYEPDKLSIGTFMGQEKPFTNYKIDYQSGDTFYIFTDGYADQFGGPQGKKFRYKPMGELLLSLQDKKMAEQDEILLNTFNSWKGNLEQVDDVLVIGVRV